MFSGFFSKKPVVEEPIISQESNENENERIATTM